MDKYARHILRLIPPVELVLADIDLKNRSLVYETLECQRRMEFTSEVVQGWTSGTFLMVVG